MGLPKIQQPLFEVTIPSTGKKAKFRPFTVKEEKILLVAQQANDVGQMVIALKQILTNCIEDVDVEKLAMFDIEYLMLKVRGQSVNNEIEFTVKDPDTEEDVNLKININEVEMKMNPDHNNIIELSDTHKIIMRYSTLDELKVLASADENNQSEKMFEVMVSCIDSLVEGEDTVYKLSDFTKDEIDEFVESLTSKTVNDIQKFFQTIPVLKIQCPYTNSKGEQRTFVVEGLQSFFI
jgi:hypothetical protein